MTAMESRTADAAAPSVVRALIRRIVDGVAAGQKYHLKVVFQRQAHARREFRRTWLFYLGGVAETFEAAREIIFVHPPRPA